MKPNTNFYDCLGACIKRYGTQSEAAKAAGVDPSTISRLARGAEPSLSTAVRIAGAAGWVVRIERRK